MSNVLAFRPRPIPDSSDRLTALCRAVAQERRLTDDVFWLKENAELLGILVATDADLPAQTLTIYDDFYDTIEDRLRFYPQYYRFFVSLCLDLEDLGLDGCKGASICDWAVANGLAEAELSDLQRAEARRLLARRGAAEPADEGALGSRLRAFMERPATFALPNKKAAYELTHIVFYLSEYGKVDPRLSPAAITSLEYLGVVAYLDQDHDLLAEVCVALVFAGQTPSEIWTEAVADAHAAMVPQNAPGRAQTDGFHAYLVTGWAMAALDRPYLQADVSDGQVHFADLGQRRSVLRPLSECLLGFGAERSRDWAGMRGKVVPMLDGSCCEILERAEASSSQFEGFFAQFARATGT